MEKFWQRNINLLLGLFLLLGPILDALTGMNVHYFHFNVTIGIMVRILFLISIMIIVLFVFKKKKVIIPYLIIGIYGLFYIIGMIQFKGKIGLFEEIQGLFKSFYYPILLTSLYAIREEIHISKLTLFTTLFLYLIFIFVPLLLGIGYKTYEITKAGTLGFYNSANEIGGIIAILTPILCIIIHSSKKWLPKLAFLIMYLVVILMMGTKTPLLSLGITIFVSFIYFIIIDIKTKKYKRIVISFLIILIGVLGIITILPKTNFYKNIETHLDYLRVEKITDIIKKEELIDHFIFSQRLTFFHNKALLYYNANNYQKLFGIGYTRRGKTIKMIEMDYFDIFYSHGIVGFLVFMIITFRIIYKILEQEDTLSYERCMLAVSLFLILITSLLTGHIIIAPSVSYIVIIIILSLYKKDKKELFFASNTLEIGGIETALVNLLNRIDTSKYNITLVLEKQKGDLLNRLNKNILVKELKVSNHKNVIIRKVTNAARKLWFKIMNYENYDYSCCYATYSYSSNILAKIASKNNSLYVHSDYKKLYKKEEEFKEFFDSRKVQEFNKIIFVSNESRNSFIKSYKELKEKCLVINNFVDISMIREKSKEKIKTIRQKNKTLFVFVGRLDDSSKKLKRAMNLVKELNIELWIIGDGPDRAMYEEYQKELKLDKEITFFGMKKNPYPYMKEADYIILTSDYEGFPVIYLEALILEKQIITTIPTSDDEINMKDYAFIISKENNKKEVEKIIQSKNKKKAINMETVYQNRMNKLETLFNNE